MSLASEEKIHLKRAAKLTPEPVHPSAPWRWMRRGILARNGERIYLEGVRVGGKLMTSKQAMERFFAAVAEADAEHFQSERYAKPAHSKPSASRRVSEIELAKKEMKDADL